VLLYSLSHPCCCCFSSMCNITLLLQYSFLSTLFLLIDVRASSLVVQVLILHFPYTRLLSSLCKQDDSSNTVSCAMQSCGAALSHRIDTRNRKKLTIGVKPEMLKIKPYCTHSLNMLLPIISVLCFFPTYYTFYSNNTIFQSCLLCVYSCRFPFFLTILCFHNGFCDI